MRDSPTGSPSTRGTFRLLDGLETNHHSEIQCYFGVDVSQTSPTGSSPGLVDNRGSLSPRSEPVGFSDTNNRYRAPYSEQQQLFGVDALQQNCRGSLSPSRSEPVGLSDTNNRYRAPYLEQQQLFGVDASRTSPTGSSPSFVDSGGSLSPFQSEPVGISDTKNRRKKNCFFCGLFKARKISKER